MIVLTENLIKALQKTKEKNIYLMGLKLTKGRVLELLKANDNHEIVELTTGKLSWHDITYHTETKRNLDKATGLVSNDVVDSKSAVSDVKDAPCLKFYFNHEQPIITARLIESFIPDKKFATIKINTEYKPFAPSGIRINPSDLLSALNIVSPAMASEETRAVLHALFFELTPDTITLTAADGFRLHTTHFNCETGLPVDYMAAPVISKFLIDHNDIPKLISLINSIPKIKHGGKRNKYQITTEYQEAVYLDISPKAVTFAIPDKTLTFQTIEGNFPNYKQLIPKDNGTSFSFVPGTMLNTIKPLKKLVADSSGIIRLQIAEVYDGTEAIGALTISGRAEETGDSVIIADTTKSCIYTSESTDVADRISRTTYDKIAVNYQYFADALKSFADCFGFVRMDITSSSSPMKFTAGDTVMVLMPMFVQWETPKVAEPEPAVMEDETENLDTTETNEELARAETATV